MEEYLKTQISKRFITQDSITKVTSDGEPHEIMTLVAGLSGLFAAFVILAILVAFIGCKKRECSDLPHGSAPPSPGGISTIPDNSSQRSSILPIFRNNSYAEDDITDNSPRLISVSIISNNLGGNLNSAFVGSELRFSNEKSQLTTTAVNTEKF